MIEQSVSLASNGVVKVPGYEQLVRFGYTKNKGVYRLNVTATGEWEGLTIRAFWHLPGGKDPASSLVVDGYVDVPASVTAQPGNGCVTFEGSDGTKTVTSADLRYRVSANSGTEDGAMPEPGTPAWQQLVDAVHTDATAAEQAKTDAQTAAQQAGASAQKAGQALSDTINAKEDALKAIGDKQTTATQAVDTARDKALQQVEASTEAAQTAASEAATSADKAADSEKAAGDAQAKAAESLQELKDGIASGNFKGEPGTSPTVTVQDITGGHRIVITDATGTSFVDVLNGKQGDPGKPGNTGATPELTIGTVEEGDAPSATITGTAKNPVLNLTLKSGAPGKDATVDATLSQSGKAADAKVTGDELARKAVIDDTTVGTDAWSSKHIVDMLCPPLEESGNPVVCYPVAGYALGVTAKWEPMQEGTGTPSPENIRPIHGRDSVKVERCGENLLNIKPFNKFTKKGITYEYVPDGGIHISGTATTTVDSSTFPVWHLPPGKYYGLETGEEISASIVVQRNGKPLRLNAKGAFEILAGDVTKYWYAIVSAGATVDKTVYPYIVSGTTAPTTYKPYIGQTNTLTLPETVYGGEVDAVTGEGQDTWGLVTFDGTENWIVSGKFLGDKTDWYYASPKIPNAVNASPQKGNEICSHYPHVNVANNNAVKGCAIVWGAIRIRWGDTIPDDTDAWKAYLAAQKAAGTPVQVAYKLAEPVPITATGGTALPALAGANTVLTDADSATVTGRADPIKRIIDLEAAVASIN